jgi:hypothetical protein
VERATTFPLRAVVWLSGARARDTVEERRDPVAMPLNAGITAVRTMRRQVRVYVAHAAAPDSNSLGVRRRVPRRGLDCRNSAFMEIGEAPAASRVTAPLFSTDACVRSTVELTSRREHGTLLQPPLLPKGWWRSQRHLS